MFNIEMHSHTCFSPDGFITPSTFAKWCRKRRLDCVCITDHNNLSGAVEFAKKVPVKVVIGEEISTGAGDIIGLFLKEEISPGLGLNETIDRIRSQAGLVYLPHPMDEFRKSSVKLSDAERVKREIDILEIFNSRTFNPRYNLMASEFARKNGIVVAVGSDAHHQFELGNSYMRMDEFNGPESFLASLRGATYIARKCPFALRLYIKGLKILTGKD